jgi:FKBP-type peptidyl-prolyl cis-trans isomerase
MNSKVISAIIAIVVVGFSLGCQSEKFQVSDDGYQYKYITKGSGETPKQGDVVVYNMTYKNEKDSIIGESTAGQPFMIPCDTMQWSVGGALYKAFGIIKEGDSILIKIPTKQVFDESFRADVPPTLDPAGDITFYIGASNVMSMEEAQVEATKMRQKQQEEMLAASAEQMEIDIEIIDAHLKENNITAQSTESGLRYVIAAEGSGQNPEPGQMVFVHYTGTLLDGKQFDSSLDRGEPLDFPIGQGNVIPGWDEGIALLKKGGKGTLYIPSPLAYGARGAGADIPPNAVLKFDVELVDIN